MSYDPMFDAARQAVDDVLGKGEYARLNADNPGVPAALRKKLKREVAKKKAAKRP